MKKPLLLIVIIFLVFPLLVNANDSKNKLICKAESNALSIRSLVIENEKVTSINGLHPRASKNKGVWKSFDFSSKGCPKGYNIISQSQYDEFLKKYLKGKQNQKTIAKTNNNNQNDNY